MCGVGGVVFPDDLVYNRKRRFLAKMEIKAHTHNNEPNYNTRETDAKTLCIHFGGAEAEERSRSQSGHANCEGNLTGAKTLS